MVVDYDAELRRYSWVLRRAFDVRPGERVLDLGCGAGQTTREAARAAGSVLGVDVSAAAIERARSLAAGLSNVAFEVLDAQAHEFAAGSFDLAISRFGTMFFGDPGAAFGNVARALRAGGRLVMAVWQAADRNAWDVAIRSVLPAVAAGGPDPFSLAEPEVVEELLRRAGFTGIAFEDVGEPVFYGADAEAALAWVRGFSCTGAALRDQPPDAAAAIEARLRGLLAVHQKEDGVWFDSRAWIVSARRPGP